MKKLLIGIGVLIFGTACAVSGEALASGKPTPVSIITDWGDSDPEVRVVRVTVDDRKVVCVEAREQHGGGLSGNPTTAGVSISCDWTLR